jgi:hypothetical protein
LLDHERHRLRPGLVILADKGFAGRQFEQLVAGHGARLLRPDRTDEPDRHGSLGRWRQWIESTFDTLIRKSTMSRQAAAPGAAQRSRVQAVDARRLRRRAAG